MRINFFNETKEKTKEYEKLIKNVFKNFNNKKEFNIIFVSKEEIQKINREYRKIDKVTDVISFAFEEVDDVEYDNIRFLGEIYICYDRCVEQANEYGHSVKREFCYLAVHGLLHLLGYDHMTEEDKKVMRAEEESILNEYDITR